ncbi:hypothetical protein ACQ9ZF_12270 (plasmid) [Cetobacterium somerae]|uniref:hypothetical protein n=1 Tax=Cetobacterium somerae TaxID=188913 RepID=UPI003D767240
MKKLLLVGAFVISAVSFANIHDSHGSMNGNMDKGIVNNSSEMMNCKMMNGSMGKGMMSGGMMGMNMTPELRKEMQDDMIKIQEKQLEINKIMNTSKPDMKKVEKLNNEIYQIKATHMTKMQQNIKTTN